MESTSDLSLRQVDKNTQHGGGGEANDDYDPHLHRNVKNPTT